MRTAVLLAWLAFAALLLLSLPLLPAEVGDNAGQALPKLAYVAVMLASATLPLLLMGEAPLRWLAGHAPLLLKMPHRRYWLAPERFEASLTRLCAHMHWMRLWVLVLLAGVHLVLLWRSHPAWPQVPGWAAGLALPALMLASMFWAIRVRRLFPRPPKS